jgi:hypothetical protein
MDLLPLDAIQSRIYFVRDQKIMLDSDLAKLYGVTTFNLNKAVRRNLKRFPSDFMFHLTPRDYGALIFQIGISNKGRGGRRHLPYVFTRDGVSMLSSVLRSERAIHVNITIMRAFGRMTETLATHKELTCKIDELEKKYDAQFRVVFDAIRELMKPPMATPLRIVRGFKKD